MAGEYYPALRCSHGETHTLAEINFTLVFPRHHKQQEKSTTSHHHHHHHYSSQSSRTPFTAFATAVTLFPHHSFALLSPPYLPRYYLLSTPITHTSLATAPFRLPLSSFAAAACIPRPPLQPPPPPPPASPISISGPSHLSLLPSLAATTTSTTTINYPYSLEKSNGEEQCEGRRTVLGIRFHYYVGPVKRGLKGGSGDAR
ncbi:hypothetical protein E2C01_045094 [Portunus trituberculatus]|uniref:Uncharacterized protein n=1 Tax=Portunus trituberculatus TaxID=210409 RepID=A0A5B7FTZ8_PORTR|nr:hypothetical protein [Portunus trituberculatus]